MMWLTTTIQLVLGIDIVWLRPREIPMGMHAAALALIFALPSIRNSQVISQTEGGRHIDYCYKGRTVHRL